MEWGLRSADIFEEVENSVHTSAKAEQSPYIKLNQAIPQQTHLLQMPKLSHQDINASFTERLTEMWKTLTRLKKAVKICGSTPYLRQN